MKKVELTRTEASIRKLYDLDKRGIDGPDNPVWVSRLRDLRQRHVNLEAEIGSLERMVPSDVRTITPEVVERFGELLSSEMRARKKALGQAYLRLIIDAIDVTTAEVRMTGSSKSLERLVVASVGTPKGGVPSSVPEWCGRDDSVFDQFWATFLYETGRNGA